MNLDRILSEIDLEISRLQQAKQLLSEHSAASPAAKRGPGRPPASVANAALKHTSSISITPKRRTMSAAGRARIAAAQKARWAKTKKAAKKATNQTTAKKTAAKKTGKKLGRPSLKKSAAPKPEVAGASAA